MRAAAGVVLGGRYALTELLATGGMGEVWHAEDTRLGRAVAAKVLREEHAGDPQFLGRLRTEARNTANLSHPNIAMLHDYGEVDGVGYLIMELVLGEPLSEVMRRERVLGLNVLLPILAQTARALHVAHVAGVVHRDVKPSNLLLTPDGRVKVTDFGISLAANQAPMTAAGVVMGTAQYLPPEQAMGKAATPAGDIYALGIVAYEALVGRRPFTGASEVEIAFAHVREAVPALPPHIDPSVRAIVESMLKKEPGLRPRSAASLARAFDRLAERLIQSEPRPAGPASPSPVRDGGPGQGGDGDDAPPQIGDPARTHVVMPWEDVLVGTPTPATAEATPAARHCASAMVDRENASSAGSLGHNAPAPHSSRRQSPRSAAIPDTADVADLPHVGQRPRGAHRATRPWSRPGKHSRPRRRSSRSHRLGSQTRRLLVLAAALVVTAAVLAALATMVGTLASATSRTDAASAPELVPVSTTGAIRPAPEIASRVEGP